MFESGRTCCRPTAPRRLGKKLEARSVSYVHELIVDGIAIDELPVLRVDHADRGIDREAAAQEAASSSSAPVKRAAPALTVTLEAPPVPA